MSSLKYLKFLKILYTIKHYIVTKNVFLVIVHNLLVLQKYYKSILLIVFKFSKNKRLICLKKVKPSNLRFSKQNNHRLWFMLNLKVFEYQKIMRSKIQMCLKYQNHTSCSYGYNLEYVHDKFSKPFKSYLGKILFTNLLLAWTKKLNIVVAWWKNNLLRGRWQLRPLRSKPTNRIRVIIITK